MYLYLMPDACRYVQMSILIRTLHDYCPRERKDWLSSTAGIGAKLMYVPSPEPVLCVPVVRLSHWHIQVLVMLPLLPAGDFGSIPQSMVSSRDRWFALGTCDRDEGGRPGTGSKLCHVDTWAMIWPTDYPGLP
jgi:hypothetical protein